jgi:F0F1-type ATP synthase beta subunit
VSVAQTLDGVEKIIDGKMDDRSEEEFYMIGSFE